jgi:hypothetical protein
VDSEETVLLPVVGGAIGRNEPRPTWVANSSDLGAALRTLREAVGEARFPLDHGAAATARQAARELRNQLDDYLVPRSERLDAPLLVVVGGSTGAGKSTLVNSLVRAPVSRSGVLRPTTVGPVLVCHPTDSAWFSEQRLLSGLARATSPGDGVLHVVSSPILRPGLALLDAPDIDSVVTRNRELAHELLGAADLWLFVTTAARYADEVPWRVLRQARDRGTVVAVVLDRVPPPARDDVIADLSRLLSEQGLPAAPLFPVDESTLDGQGLLPVEQVRPVEAYLAEVASDEVRRRQVTRRTLLGAVAAAAAATDDLAFAAVQQCAAADALAATVRSAFDRAASSVGAALSAGEVLRGAVYARWRDAVASGDVQRALRAAQDQAKARPAPALPGRPVQASVETALAALLAEADTAAVEEISDRWKPLLEPEAEPQESAVAPRDLVSGWQAWLRASVAAPAGTRATTSAAVVLLATVAVVAPAADDVTAAGAPSDSLRALLRDPSVTDLADQARAELLTRVGEHFASRARRWLHRLGALGIDPELAPRLRQAAADVSVARQLASGSARAAA